MSMQTIEVNGIQMHYAVYGSGKPIVLVHGMVITSTGAKSWASFCWSSFRGSERGLTPLEAFTRV